MARQLVMNRTRGAFGPVVQPLSDTKAVKGIGSNPEFIPPYVEPQSEKVKAFRSDWRSKIVGEEK